VLNSPERVGGVSQHPRTYISQGDRMSESDTYKIIEIAGTSPDGVSEAMR
jgi:hypothetical protein